MNACTTVQTLQQVVCGGSHSVRSQPSEELEVKGFGLHVQWFREPRWSRHDQKGHLVDLCYSASVVEDALGQGGLPRVDVGWNPDVADPLVRDDARGACPTTVDEHLADLTGDKRSSH